MSKAASDSRGKATHMDVAFLYGRKIDDDDTHEKSRAALGSCSFFALRGKRKHDSWLHVEIARKQAKQVINPIKPI
jgi:hypothetical protein